MKLYIYEFKMANMTVAVCKEHSTPKELHKIAKGGARFIATRETDGTIQCDRCVEIERSRQQVFRFINGPIIPKEEGVTTGNIKLRHLRMLAKEYTSNFFFDTDKKDFLLDIRKIVKGKYNLKEEDDIQLRVQKGYDISFRVGTDEFEFDVYDLDSDVGDEMVDLAERILYTLKLKDTCAKKFRPWVHCNLPEWAKPTEVQYPCEVCGHENDSDNSCICKKCHDDGWMVCEIGASRIEPIFYTVDIDQMIVFGSNR